MPKVKVSHGHYGELFLNAQFIAEVTAIEYSIEIAREEVPQIGTRWTTNHEGLITGTGELTLHKVYSDWEGAFLPYVSLSVDEMRNRRDAGQPLRPLNTLKVAIDDPQGQGREYETLTGVQFWQYTGGFDITALIGRTWPFTFEGIIAPPGSRILRNGSGALY